MFGLTYLQQVADSTTGGGLHIEPGIWAVVPETTDPPEQSTVVRMASIPHGTAMIAQGIASSAPGPPTILATSIVPFGIDDDERPGFVAGEINFPELILTRPTQFRVTAPGITTAMLMNPNSILTDLNATQTIRSTTTLHVTTTPLPVPGGGTVNTAFLGAGNAIASSVDATFWIESVEDADGGPDTLQLQYSQTVMLDFKKLRWPHVIVGTLQREG
jgi:hypothetical protein